MPPSKAETESIQTTAAAAAAAAATIVASALAKERADERISMVEARAKLEISIANLTGRFVGHEEVCSERWRQQNIKMNALMGLTVGTLMSILGYTLMFWAQHVK